MRFPYSDASSYELIHFKKCFYHEYVVKTFRSRKSVVFILTRFEIGLVKFKATFAGQEMK